MKSRGSLFYPAKSDAFDEVFLKCRIYDHDRQYPRNGYCHPDRCGRHFEIKVFECSGILQKDLNIFVDVVEYHLYRVKMASASRRQKVKPVLPVVPVCYTSEQSDGSDDRFA